MQQRETPSIYLFFTDRAGKSDDTKIEQKWPGPITSAATKRVSRADETGNCFAIKNRGLGGWGRDPFPRFPHGGAQQPWLDRTNDKNQRWLTRLKFTFMRNRLTRTSPRWILLSGICRCSLDDPKFLRVIWSWTP